MDQIVVARFREDVSWVSALADDIEIFIYNKGPSLVHQSFKENVRVIEVPNVGRETETYLSHIRNNDFSKKSGRVIFTQGNPFDHSPDFIKLIEFRSLWKPIQSLAFTYLSDQNIPPRLLLNSDAHEYIGGCRIRTERYSLHTWAPLSFNDKGAWNIGFQYKNLHKLDDGINIAEHFYSSLGFDEYARMAAGHEIGIFSYGAIFSVDSNILDKFKNLVGSRIDRLVQISQTVPVYGYIFERSWLHLFGVEYIKFNLK